LPKLLQDLLEILNDEELNIIEVGIDLYVKISLWSFFIYQINKSSFSTGYKPV